MPSREAELRNSVAAARDGEAAEDRVVAQHAISMDREGPGRDRLYCGGRRRGSPTRVRSVSALVSPRRRLRREPGSCEECGTLFPGRHFAILSRRSPDRGLFFLVGAGFALPRSLGVRTDRGRPTLQVGPAPPYPPAERRRGGVGLAGADEVSALSGRSNLRGQPRAIPVASTTSRIRGCAGRHRVRAETGIVVDPPLSVVDAHDISAAAKHRRSTARPGWSLRPCTSAPQHDKHRPPRRAGSSPRARSSRRPVFSFLASGGGSCVRGRTPDAHAQSCSPGRWKLVRHALRGPVRRPIRSTVTDRARIDDVERRVLDAVGGQQPARRGGHSHEGQRSNGVAGQVHHVGHRMQRGQEVHRAISPSTSPVLGHPALAELELGGVGRRCVTRGFAALGYGDGADPVSGPGVDGSVAGPSRARNMVNPPGSSLPAGSRQPATGTPCSASTRTATAFATRGPACTPAPGRPRRRPGSRLGRPGRQRPPLPVASHPLVGRVVDEHVATRRGVGVDAVWRRGWHIAEVEYQSTEQALLRPVPAAALIVSRVPTR